MSDKPVSQTSTFGPHFRSVDIGQVMHVARDRSLILDCGKEVHDIPMAYQTYGQLNEAKDNAILICHALTGDQFVIGTHPVTGRPGWWEVLVGPGKVIDTDKYFVICINVIGGCMGSFGPKHHDAEHDEPYGIDFPVVTIGDMVKAQKLVIDALGIEKLFAVIGGSMGGMQVLEWASRYPSRIRTAIPIATSANHSAQNIAFHEIARQAIMADPDWRGGGYYKHEVFPERGLAIARMTAHVTYLSEIALQQKFGRNLQDRAYVSFGFEADFQIESYLRHQGQSFVERFDPNSYLYITRAMDYFDLMSTHGGKLSKAFPASDIRFCVICFSSDWLFTPADSRAIVQALNAQAANVSFVEVQTDKGHDAFLLNEPEMFATIRGFLEGSARALNLTHGGTA